MSPTLLAIETATAKAGVALSVDGVVLSSWWLAGGNKHTESLMPAIEFVTDTAAVSVSSLDAICVDVGPGLFTGIRVGLSTAKGLAHALGISLVAVTSLEVMANPFRNLEDLVAVIDAKRGEVFWRRFSPSANNLQSTPERGVELGALSTPDELADEITQWRKEGDNPVFVGDGALRYQRELGIEAGMMLSPLFSNPLPEHLAELSNRAFLDGKACSPELVEPVYMRQADARVNFEMRS